MANIIPLILLMILFQPRMPHSAFRMARPFPVRKTERLHETVGRNADAAMML
jgi:hypothetical protein